MVVLSRGGAALLVSSSSAVVIDDHTFPEDCRMLQRCTMSRLFTIAHLSRNSFVVIVY
jgi:hypothetical protein